MDKVRCFIRDIKKLEEIYNVQFVCNKVFYFNSIKLKHSASLERPNFSLVEKVRLCPLVAQITLLSAI